MNASAYNLIYTTSWWRELFLVLFENSITYLCCLLESFYLKFILISFLRIYIFRILMNSFLVFGDGLKFGTSWGSLPLESLYMLLVWLVFAVMSLKKMRKECMQYEWCNNSSLIPCKRVLIINNYSALCSNVDTLLYIDLTNKPVLPFFFFCRNTHQYNNSIFRIERLLFLPIYCRFINTEIYVYHHCCRIRSRNLRIHCQETRVTLKDYYVYELVRVFVKYLLG